jgi:hypothetical protein
MTDACASPCPPAMALRCGFQRKPPRRERRPVRNVARYRQLHLT